MTRYPTTTGLRPDVGRPAVTPRERELLAQPTWTIDQLVTLVFVLRRLVAELDRHGDHP